MAEIHYMTQEGLDKLKKDLADALAQRPVISAAIGEAREKGDLSENAEYDAARDAQGLLEVKIAKLKDLVANAKVIDESKIGTDKVQIMNKVKSKISIQCTKIIEIPATATYMPPMQTPATITVPTDKHRFHTPAQETIDRKSVV